MDENGRVGHRISKINFILTNFRGKKYKESRIGKDTYLQLKLQCNENSGAVVNMELITNSVVYIE